MNPNTIIIDDEPIARKGLREYINDVGFLHLSGEFDNALAASDFIGRGDVQLMLLDIQMPGMAGVDFVRALQHPPPVIFTTAYPQFALDGFEVNAIDYLLKPISFNRFVKAVNKAKEYYEVRERNFKETENADYFYIKSGSTLVKIFFDDIIYVEALQNYVVIHTAGAKHMTYLTFKAVQDNLPATAFVKVHKSFIVAAAKITSIDANEILIGTKHIPISRGLKDEVLEILLKGKFLKR